MGSQETMGNFQGRLYKVNETLRDFEREFLPRGRDEPKLNIEYFLQFFVLLRRPLFRAQSTKMVRTECRKFNKIVIFPGNGKMVFYNFLYYQ